MSLVKNKFPSTASMLLVLVSFVVLLVALQTPLLGTPTLEAGLFLGAFLAPLTFMVGVSRGALRGHAGFLKDLSGEAIWVSSVIFVYLFVLGLHSLGSESCSPSSGFLPFFLVLGPQIFLNLVTGIWVGRLVGSPKPAVFVGLCLLGLYIGFLLLLWWLEPSMRFFDPYWLLFTGDLFKGQPLELPLIAYRISTLLYACALLALGVHWKKHATQFWVIFFLLTSAVTMHMKSSTLIAPSLENRHQDYPDKIIKGQIILHTNLMTVGEKHAQGILQEAELWLNRIQERMGIQSTRPIDIWLYGSPASLNKHTGAKNVHFTLPAHREIHITGTEIPHPTLGHELAHVLLGEVSGTLWGMPGIWGILPNWGISEGLATYLTPELSLQDDLNLEEQAAALYLLGLEKSPENLFETDLWSFWTQSSNRAYVASAALLGAFIDSQCRTPVCKAKMVKKLAEWGEVNLKDSFVQSYHARLKEASLPPDALPSVLRRFSPPSILLATCKDGVWQGAEPPKQELKTSNPLELPIYRQREWTIRKAFEVDKPYTRSGLEVLRNASFASFGKLGFDLGRASEADEAYYYGIYLLARAEILAADFTSGLSLMPANLTGLIGQESKRLIALAQSQTGQVDRAIVGFEQLKNQAVRPADRIKFGDLLERARGLEAGQSFLLGVWEKD